MPYEGGRLTMWGPDAIRAGLHGDAAELGRGSHKLQAADDQSCSLGWSIFSESRFHLPAGLKLLRSKPRPLRLRAAAGWAPRLQSASACKCPLPGNLLLGGGLLGGKSKAAGVSAEKQAVPLKPAPGRASSVARVRLDCGIATNLACLKALP